MARAGLEDELESSGGASEQCGQRAGNQGVSCTCLGSSRRGGGGSRRGSRGRGRQGGIVELERWAVRVRGRCEDAEGVRSRCHGSGDGDRNRGEVAGAIQSAQGSDKADGGRGSVNELDGDSVGGVAHHGTVLGPGDVACGRANSPDGSIGGVTIDARMKRRVRLGWPR